MKPVQLLPSEQRAATASTQDRPVALILSAGIGIFALVGGYFGYAQVSGMKLEAENMRAEAGAAAQEESRVRQEIAELGERTSYSNLASMTETAVTDALGKRFPYSAFLAAIDEAVPEKALWVSEMEVAVTSDSVMADSTGIRLAGHAVDEITVAAFHQRLRAVPGLDGVVLESVRAEPVTDNTTVQTFSITAQLQPSAFSASGTPTSGDPTLISDGGNGLEVALDPVPKATARPKPKVQPKPKPKPKPKTTLEQLAETTTKAGGKGGGS